MIVWASGDGGHAASAGFECQVDRDRQGQRHWKITTTASTISLEKNPEKHRGYRTQGQCFLLGYSGSLLAAFSSDKISEEWMALRMLTGVKAEEEESLASDVRWPSVLWAESARSYDTSLWSLSGIPACTVLPALWPLCVNHPRLWNQEVSLVQLLTYPASNPSPSF